MSDEKVLGHAITFVNNHLPLYGEENYRYDDPDDMKEKVSRHCIDYVPGSLRVELNEALVSALKFIQRSFQEE